MERNVCKAAFFALMTVIAVSAMGQDRTQWQTASDIREGVRGTFVGTVVDTDESQRVITLSGDDDRYQQITVRTDSVATQYNGFGGVINGSPEIFKGSKGFSNLRDGDRIEVRGTGRGTGILMADQVTLLGRQVPAGTTGVGETRPATSVSTPTVASNTTQDVYGRVEGVIRQINAKDNRLVIETDRREIFNIRTSSSTPVYYEGDVYQVSNLEPGDRIRVESDDSTLAGREIRARVIDVVKGVQDRGTSTDRRIGSVAGRVTRVDRAGEIVRIDTGRQEVRVDTSRANDSAGRRVRASDIQVGDRIEATGSYAPSSDLFAASTIRFSEDVFAPRTGPAEETDNDDDREDQETGDYVVVTISGTVTETLADSPTLGVRDRANGRNLRVFVTEDFTVRNKTGGYMTADKLAVNDPVMIKAYRDEDGNVIAQTIRIR